MSGEKETTRFGTYEPRPEIMQAIKELIAKGEFKPHDHLPNVWTLRVNNPESVLPQEILDLIADNRAKISDTDIVVCEPGAEIIKHGHPEDTFDIYLAFGDSNAVVTVYSPDGTEIGTYELQDYGFVVTKPGEKHSAAPLDPTRPMRILGSKSLEE